MTSTPPHTTPRVANPTVIVGLGPRGVAAVDALERAAAWSNHRDRHPAGADPHVHLVRAPTLPLPPLAPVFDAILDIAAQAATHRTFGQSSPPIDVFIVAAPADPDLPPTAIPTLLTTLDAALAPHAQRLRLADGASRLHICPLLLLPPMPPAPRSAAQLAARDAIAAFEALDATATTSTTPPSPLHLGRIYLIEPGTRTFTLNDESVETMVVSFLSFLLFGSLRRDVDAYQAAWERRPGTGPFASFLIGTVSVPHHRLRQFLAHKAALTALDALNAPRPAPLPTEAHHDALIANHWLPSARDKASDHARRTFAPLTPPSVPHPPRLTLLESGADWLAHRADPALDHATAAQTDAWRRALDPDTGLAEAIRHISLFSLDDLRAAEDALRSHLDKDWLDNPDNDAHPNDVLRILDELDRNVSRQRADYAARARRTPPPQAALADLASVRADLATAAADKPDALRLGIWTALAAAVVAFLLAPTATIIGLPTFATPITVAILAVAFYALSLHGPTRAVNAFLAPDGRLTRALERLGTEFSAHADLCREVAVDHAMDRLLTRQQLHIADEKARLVDAVTAARAARAERADALRAMLNTNLSDDALATAPVALDDHILTQPILSAATFTRLVDDDWLKGFVGNEPVRHLKQIARPLRNRMTKQPFSDLRPLDDAADVFIRNQYGDIGSFVENPRFGAEATSRVIGALRALIGLQTLTGGAGMRFHLPLQTTDLSNTHHDAPRLLMTDRVRAALGRALNSNDQEELDELGPMVENARTFHDPDRISLLQMTWSIHRAQIPWLAAPDTPPRPEAAPDNADPGPDSSLGVIQGPWGKAS